MIAALVLAAGQSRRMGSPKLLLPLGDRPVIARVVDEVLGGPIDHVVVVVGSDGQGIVEALAGRPVQLAVNPDRAGDMLSSVRCGLRTLPDQCDGVMIVLGDQPQITSEVVRLLVNRFQARRSGIVVPTHRGKRGHPLLLATHYQSEILNHFADVGLRGLLDAHPQDVLEVEIDSPDILEDMDRPEDYQRILKSMDRPS